MDEPLGMKSLPEAKEGERESWESPALLLTIAVWSLLVVAAWCSADPEGGKWSVIVLLVVAVGAYWTEVLSNPTFKDLLTMERDDGAIEYLSRQKHASPRVEICVECSHDEMPTLKKHVLGSDVLPIEVLTYTKTENFRYDQWDDISGSLECLPEHCKIVDLQLSKVLQIHDQYTWNLYQTKKRNFAMDNWKDEKCEVSDRIFVEGFKKRIVAFKDVESKSCFISPTAYILFSMIGMTWPYRLFVRGKWCTIKMPLRKTIRVFAPTGALEKSIVAAYA